MLSMFNTAVKSIIDVLKLRQDARKADLEIGRLEREKKQAESVLHIASVEEIKKYDPRVKALFQRASAPEKLSILGWIVLLLALCLVALAL